jgi:hypothetical protein
MIEPFDSLIRERIPDGPYALFWCTGEGRFLPNGEEESSGHVIVPSGEIWFWWTGWDAEARRVVFAIWEPVATDVVEWQTYPGDEYQQACAQLGLT